MVADLRDTIGMVEGTGPRLRSSASIRVVDPTDRQNQGQSVPLFWYAHPTESACFRDDPRQKRLPAPA
jgi:hypothetical protein